MSNSPVCDELRRLVAGTDLAEAVYDAIIDSGCAHRLFPGSNGPEPAWLTCADPDVLRRLAEMLIRKPGYPQRWLLVQDLLGLELLERIARGERKLPAATLMQRLLPGAPPEVVNRDGPDQMIDELALRQHPRYGEGVREVIVAYAARQRTATTRQPTTTKAGP